jgi:hypothetical protein
MTTKESTMHDATPNILLIGRSRRVLDEAVAILRERGYAAEGTNDFGDITGRFDTSRLDVTVFGGQVPPDTRVEIREQIEALGERVVFVQGLSGIPGLIAEQVQQALDGERTIPGQTPVYDAAQRAILLSLFAPLDVTVTAHWITSLTGPEPESESRVLFDGPEAAGDHVFAIPGDVALDAAFATVRAGDARWSFRLA